MLAFRNQFRQLLAVDFDRDRLAVAAVDDRRHFARGAQTTRNVLSALFPARYFESDLRHCKTPLMDSDESTLSASDSAKFPRRARYISNSELTESSL
jgi:hypothetical protein